MSDPMIPDKGKDAASGLTLDGRKGLPVDLLFLTKSHPRETWPGHPGLAGTGDIWLSNHDYFRAATAQITDSLNKLRNEPATTYDSGPSFQRISRDLLGGLGGHHRIEDHHYFPMFQRIEPRLARGFEILDADHHMIHDAIDQFATTAHDFLRRIGQTEGPMTSDARYSADEMAGVADRFGRTLRQHLADEEDLVIPLIIERAQTDAEFG